MSLQIFLRGKILGVEQFLSALPEREPPPRAGEDEPPSGRAPGAVDDFEGRVDWASLLSEVLPRALLAELGLPKVLLGMSGGHEFLAVLPMEARPRAEEFLAAAARNIERVSGSTLRLVWASTENLGDWTIVRRRLGDEMQAKIGARLPGDSTGEFAPFSTAAAGDFSGYFRSLAAGLRQARSVGWTESETLMEAGEGKHAWPLSRDPDGIPFPRHAAPADDDAGPASPATLAARARGRKTWGMLRGEVDHIEIRFRRAQSVEETIQISTLYKQFFAGELEVLCSMPESWRKLTLVYSGGNDFAVYGAWDALIPFARELQRLFHRVSEESLKDYPGAEGKTISMAIALAPGPDTPLAHVFAEAGENLEVAKSAANCIAIFGRTLEWKHLADAADTRTTMTRMVLEFGVPPQFLYELANFYRDAPQIPGQRRTRQDRLERPWRFHRRLNRVIHGSAAAARSRDFQKLRADLIADFTGRHAAQVRLRPAGRVALEWARLETET